MLTKIKNTNYKIYNFHILAIFLLFLSILLWFSGFYISYTSYGKLMILGLPIWSIISNILPAILSILIAIITIKIKTIK